MIRFRKIREQDLEMIATWRQKKEVTKYMYSDPFLTPEIQAAWYERIKHDETSRYWIISHDDTDVGLVSITEIDTHNRKCFWAYYLGDPNVRGKGIGKVVECNIYDYCFENLKLNKVNCEVLEENEIVIKIHEKYGAVKEGLFRDHVYKGDSFHNAVRMSILSSEWLSKRKELSYPTIEIEE